jgi:microcystin-dependent protein
VFSAYVSDLSAASFNDGDHVALAYRKRDSLGSLDVGMVTLMDTSTVVPQVKISIEFSSVPATFIDIVMISTKTVAVAYREPTRGYIGKGLVINLVQGDTQLQATTSVPVADASSIDTSYLLKVSKISTSKFVVAYQNCEGRPRLVDVEVGLTRATISVGTPTKFALNDHVSQSYGIAGLGANNAFLLAYQDNFNANAPHAATVVIAETRGGALRTGIATSNGEPGTKVQVAVEGLVSVPVGTLKNDNGRSESMTPGAKYYGTSDGRISASSEDGVLLGRALREELLLLENDFSGGFEAGTTGTSISSAYVGEIKSLAGPTVPPGWLKCDGRELKRTDYPALFDAIGIVWGDGDGSATFNVPDLRGRTMIGSGDPATGNGTSVSTEQFANSRMTKHELGEYDGQESIDFIQASFQSNKANKRYCRIYESNTETKTVGSSWSGWSTVTTNYCSPAYTNVLGAQYEYTPTGKFDGGSLTGARNMVHLNMMPYATLVYIIKI